MSILRLVSYNVRYFGHRAGGITSQDRTIRRIARALVDMEGGPPDVIGLQEVENASIRADLGRSRALDERRQIDRFSIALHDALEENGDPLGYQVYYFPAHEYRFSQTRNLYTTGLATLVRDDLEVIHTNSDEPFDITHRRDGALSGLKQTRICAHARILDRRGQIVDLFNTHLSLPAFFSRQFWTRGGRLGHGPNQLAEAERLVHYVHKSRYSNAPAVLMGDFNSLPGSPVYLLLTREHTFKDALREYHDTDPHMRDYPTAGLMGFRLPIDYLFSLGQVAWTDFDETHLFGHEAGRWHGLSDHVPLVARCRVERLARETDGDAAGSEPSDRVAGGPDGSVAGLD